MPEKAIMSLDLVQGDFIVIRYEGPKGGPGMREMLTPTPLGCKEQRTGQDSRPFQLHPRRAEIGKVLQLDFCNAVLRSAIMGAGLGKYVALMTDGRFSGGSHGFIIGHVSPEARLGNSWELFFHRNRRGPACVFFPG